MQAVRCVDGRVYSTPACGWTRVRHTHVFSNPCRVQVGEMQAQLGERDQQLGERDQQLRERDQQLRSLRNQVPGRPSCGLPFVLVNPWGWLPATNKAGVV